MKVSVVLLMAAAAAWLAPQSRAEEPTSSANTTSAAAPLAASPAAAQSGFRLASLQGLNYGAPGTTSGGLAGPAWLRSGTGAGDLWDACKPKFAEDLAFVQHHPNLGQVVRITVGLDQLMVWDKQTGFAGFQEECLNNFDSALQLAEAHGLQVFLVLYAQQVQNSPGNFHFEALDGRHPEMRANYLKATRIFLRRFGESPTVVGWDLFNEAYSSLGGEGGLPRPPHADPVSPQYRDETVHTWIRDLYHAAKEAAPDAQFTVSDATELYRPAQPRSEKYADAVDFYDVHIYDANPKAKELGKELGKPVILGEVGSPAGGRAAMQSNAAVARFFIEHARQCGVSAVLMHTPNHQWARWVAEAPVEPHQHEQSPQP